ncbi:unnamed protein product [Nesidiocoris tenuis]|uniref:Uncharacterized protein n=1 Tax=Nesidiocoris tenuis TaxID=355587 RepID=A0A6H5H7E5_9HEMI|nr:unnamed protein product [Nesidiocoris tenuis]
MAAFKLPGSCLRRPFLESSRQNHFLNKCLCVRVSMCPYTQTLVREVILRKCV